MPRLKAQPQAELQGARVGGAGDVAEVGAAEGSAHAPPGQVIRRVVKLGAALRPDALADGAVLLERAVTPGASSTRSTPVEGRTVARQKHVSPRLSEQSTPGYGLIGVRGGRRARPGTEPVPQSVCRLRTDRNTSLIGSRIGVNPKGAKKDVGTATSSIDSPNFCLRLAEPPDRLNRSFHFVEDLCTAPAAACSTWLVSLHVPPASMNAANGTDSLTRLGSKSVIRRDPCKLETRGCLLNPQNFQVNILIGLNRKVSQKRFR